MSLLSELPNHFGGWDCKSEIPQMSKVKWSTFNDVSLHTGDYLLLEEACRFPVFALSGTKQAPPPQDCFLVLSLLNFWKEQWGAVFNFPHFKSCKTIPEFRGNAAWQWRWSKDTGNSLMKDYFRITPTLHRDFQGKACVCTLNPSHFSKLTLRSGSQTIKLYLLLLAVIITTTNIIDINSSRNFWRRMWQNNSNFILREAYPASF